VLLAVLGARYFDGVVDGAGCRGIDVELEAELADEGGAEEEDGSGG